MTSVPVELEEAASRIPVRNAWHMLLYAWDLAQWQHRFASAAEGSPSLLGLLAEVLCDASATLIRKDLRRAYVTQRSSIRGIRGRVNFTVSTKELLFQKGMANCSFPELSHDVLKNRILRATLHKLAGDARVKHANRLHTEALRARLRRLDRALDSVSLVSVSSADFSRLHLGQNDRPYLLPLAICLLVHKLEMPKEESGDHALVALLREETLFRKVFEHFVRNFYRMRLGGCSVIKEPLSWFDETGSSLVPAMCTDISITWPDSSARLVVDTKYSATTLCTTQSGATKFKSDNLYQLYAYLRTQEERGHLFKHAEGMLLYPTTDVELNEAMFVQGHRMRVCTVDLTKPWQAIEERLLDLVRRDRPLPN